MLELLFVLFAGLGAAIILILAIAYARGQARTSDPASKHRGEEVLKGSPGSGEGSSS